MPAPPTRTGGILLLADPQIHSASGHSLKNQGWFADGIANVAVRPPVLNLLAPVALEELAASATAASHPAALVLGDATNLGCSSELERYAGAMDRGLSRNQALLPGGPTFWLIAHGNHDSYMGGNFSTFQRYRGASESGFAPGAHPERIPCGLVAGAACGVPSDYAWWNAEEAFDGAYEAGQATSWPAICANATRTSYPTNKGVWLAWYLEKLQPLGARVSVKRSGDGNYVYFRILGGAGSKLASINYVATGMWVVPELTSPSDVYGSFLVQSFDAQGKRVVVIDSSDGYLGRLAGTQGRISRRQREHIHGHVTASANPVVLASHYPLAHIDSGDADYLVELGLAHNGAAAGLEYWSGHTHAPTTVHSSANVRELNVGSTTDWPMEVAVRDAATVLGSSSGSLKVYSLMRPSDAPSVDALWRADRGFDLITLTPDASCTAEFDKFEAIWKRRSQACAHDTDAIKLNSVVLSPANVEGWDQSEGRPCAPSGTHTAAWSLHRSLAALDVALASPTARQRAVCIALAASKAEGVQIGWTYAPERMRARRFERKMADGVR